MVTLALLNVTYTANALFLGLGTKLTIEGFRAQLDFWGVTPNLPYIKRSSGEGGGGGGGALYSGAPSGHVQALWEVL